MFTSKIIRNVVFAWPWYVIVLILNCAAVAEAQFGGMAAQAEQRVFPNGLPKMEIMLQGALEHHPDILAARSKLRAAEAELLQSEFKVLKSILEIRERWQRTSDNAAPPGGTPRGVREQQAALAAVEWEIAFLVGARGEQATRPIVSQKGENTPQANTTSGELPATVITETSIPRGDQAKSLKKRLSEQVTLNIDEMPLTEFVKKLSEQCKIRFLLDKQALENDGFPADSPVGAELSDLELGAALQVLEDLHKPLYFVARDYGILVTTESERSYTKVSVSDFWKLSEEELREKVRRDREEQVRSNAGGMMGGGMGGMGGGGGGVF